MIISGIIKWFAKKIAKIEKQPKYFAASFPIVPNFYANIYHLLAK
jgi:hypothetical protein